MSAASFLHKALAKVHGTPKIVPVAAHDGIDAGRHVFDEDSVLAVDAAIAARRPLLVWGEPGAGKSQLARAAAAALGRVFLSRVIDARAEARDLMWSFDAVARLAEAQLAGALHRGAGLTSEAVREELEVRRFTSPGPLWWALNWSSAVAQARLAKASAPAPPDGWEEATGAVLLVDEIDKADASVPNGLLEVLGNRRFDTPFGAVVLASVDAPAPLVVFTTNEERALPDAFVRRCMVLHLSLPEGDPLLGWLKARGEAQFPKCEAPVLDEAASLVSERRAEVGPGAGGRPGLAEYLDLVRAVTQQRADAEAQVKLLREIAKFALRKHDRKVQ